MSPHEEIEAALDEYQTRSVGSIDRSVSLNRALWVLAEEMRKIKR